MGGITFPPLALQFRPAVEKRTADHHCKRHTIENREGYGGLPKGTAAEQQKADFEEGDEGSQSKDLRKSNLPGKQVEQGQQMAGKIEQSAGKQEQTTLRIGEGEFQPEPGTDPYPSTAQKKPDA